MKVLKLLGYALVGGATIGLGAKWIGKKLFPNDKVA